MSGTVAEPRADAIAPPETSVEVGTPIVGWATPLEEVPDPVFAGRVLGDGIAIDPFEPVLRAPCDGVITTLHRAHHALTLRTRQGAEILMHIGLDTVALKGEGFEPHVTEGQAVRRGDRLITFDMGFIAEHAPSLLVPVIVTNPESFTIASRTTGRVVRRDETVLVLRPADPGEPAEARPVAPANAAAQEVRRDVMVRTEDGIHARPAGLIAQAVRRFRAEVSLQARGRTVSARGAVGIMGLGVRGGDTLTVIGAGADAEGAVEAVAKLLDGGPVSPATEAPSGTETRLSHEAPPDARTAPPQSPSAEFTSGKEIVLHGVAAASGAAVGTAARIAQAVFDLNEPSAGPAAERERLDKALHAAEARLRAALDAAAGKQGPAHAILSAHMEFLQDPEVRERAQALIDQGKA
ncbi:MAG: HPr family phosphocarrier protein, partial [Acetobacteraceae bacterium]|nr:HPr family phosphocarrier protein [Acetobacteraceae bacterium]